MGPSVIIRSLGSYRRGSMTLYFRWHLWNFSPRKNGHDLLGQLHGNYPDDKSSPAEKLSTSMSTTSIGFISFFFSC